MSKNYTFRMISEYEQNHWDNFISQHPYGSLLQCWGWGELKETRGWKPLRVALYDGDHIIAAAQVLRRGVSYLPLCVGHLAYIPHGPVIDWSQPHLVEIFFAHLHALLRKQGTLILRAEPYLEDGSIPGNQATDILQTMRMRRIRAVQPFRTIVVDITADEQAILTAMKPKWRYNIRLAERKGVSVRVASSIDDVRAWYSLYEITSQRDKFGIHALDYYLRAWELFAPTNKLRLLLAEYNNELLAGIFVGCCSGQGFYLYGASGNEQRQLMPNYALQWEAIRWSRAQGATQYDLWGIPETDDEDEAMAGVQRFKSGWGGRTVRFIGGFELSYHPLVVRLIRRWLPSGA